MPKHTPANKGLHLRPMNGRIGFNPNSVFPISGSCMRSLKTFSAVALITVLSACVQAPKKQAFNHEAAAHIKTVAIVQAPNQESYDVVILGHPGMSFGLIGGLVAAADMASKSTDLNKAIDPAETRLQERFSAKLSEGLAKAGYVPNIVMLPKDAKEDQVLSLVKQQGNSGDAVLRINLSGAYWAAGPSTDYFPRLEAKVAALEASSGNVLYEDTISYGYAMPNAQTVHLASDSQYRFNDMSSLTQNPVKTREGLYSGLDAIVAQIVADLKKN
ncbi:hypothetical protein [Aquabacterium sp.]|uniref:hypothetical protein n=1 Tax=Aquabacterium sp. TaxID=1872578 RepID=UPI00272ABB93|nr:hypothetical protein [Aquabacterium sp.]